LERVIGYIESHTLLTLFLKEKDIQIIKNATQLYMIDKNVDTPPTVENLYKEGYLTEHVKTAKGKEYTITYEGVSGGTSKSVVVKAPNEP